MKRTLPITAALVLLVMAGVSAPAQTRPAATTPKPAAPQPTPIATTPRPATAQPASVPLVNVPNTKIAIVDTSVFSDEQVGIKRLVTAVKTVQREFQPKQAEFNTIQSRIKTLADEISKLNGSGVVDPASIQAKQEEGERLQRELKYKQEQADADVAKRYKEIVGPISTDIGKALDRFAAQYSLTMILDISKMLPAVLTLNQGSDITQAFIADYNSKNP